MRRRRLLLAGGRTVLSSHCATGKVVARTLLLGGKKRFVKERLAGLHARHRGKIALGGNHPPGGQDF